MPYIVLERFRFAREWRTVGEALPDIHGHDYARLEKQGRIEWRPAVAEPDEAEHVDIPDDWRDLPWPERRSLASKVSDDTIRTADDANAAIERALESRDE